MIVRIPWYMHDPRFTPGHVADVGNIRLILRQTERSTNNKWRLYMEIRTCKEHGVPDDLKRGVVVAEYSGKLTLDEVHKAVDSYYLDFVEGLIYHISTSD